MQFTTQATKLLFLAHFTKLITNTIYVSINEQLVSFQFLRLSIAAVPWKGLQDFLILNVSAGNKFPKAFCSRRYPIYHKPIPQVHLLKIQCIVAMSTKSKLSYTLLLTSQDFIIKQNLKMTTL